LVLFNRNQGEAANGKAFQKSISPNGGVV